MYMIKPDGIKNIIFDLGNVLIPLQMEQAGLEFRKLISDQSGIKDPMELSYLESFTLYETGKISTKDFFQSLKPYFKEEVSISDFEIAWNMIIGDLPDAHARLLKRLSNRYQLFLLSNTNELHANHFEYKIDGILNIHQVFKKVYYSHLEGFRKPQKEIYQRVLDQNRLKPSETLFADDLRENIESASELGIQTLQVTPDINLEQCFQAF